MGTYRDYLNTGTGKAWAGHCNVNVKSNFVMNIAPTWVVENLGGTRPIGSEKWCYRWNIILPVCGCWVGLCWTQQCKTDGFFKLETTRSLRASKLGRHSAHRLCACWEKAGLRRLDIKQQKAKRSKYAVMFITLHFSNRVIN